MPSQLLLSWKDHHGALVSVFENLLKSNTLVDCTLAAEGQYLKAHKVVLSACSSYFELLFSQESEKNPIVILKDVKFQELEAAVNFMYRGEVEVCEDRLGAFLEVAESLEIKGLGSDGKSQDSKGKTPVKSSKTVTTRQHSRKEVANTQSENTGESTNTLDSDQNSNNGSSPHHHQSRRETSGSSPIPSTLAIASSYSIASASTSCPIRPDAGGDRDNNQCSSPAVSLFPLRETMPSGADTVIKTEPATDTYLDEKSDETERDFDDVTMMEDQEDWDDPNPESMGDSEANQHDHAYSAADMKTNQTSDNTADAAVAEHPSSEGAEWNEGVAGRFGVVKEEDDGAGPSWGQPQDNYGAGNFGAGAADTGAEICNAVVYQPASGYQLPHYEAATGSAVYHRRSRRVCAAKRSAAVTTAPRNPAAPRTPRVYGANRTCTVCEKTFKTATRLKTHMRTHTGERPFKCTECSYASGNISNLVLHRMRHTGEKPFKCSKCDYASVAFCHLLRHSRTHEGNPKFKCPSCGVMFKTYNSLAKHRIRVHRDSKSVNPQ